MVQGKWYPMGSDVSVPLALRRAVFGRGEDALDADAWQVTVSREDAPVGAARLWWRDGAFWLGDVGVLPAERGQGMGDLLVRLLLFKALTHDARLILLKSPEETVSFFEKYGFAREGAQENGLVSMRLRGEDVHLSHCGGHCDGCEA